MLCSQYVYIYICNIVVTLGHVCWKLGKPGKPRQRKHSCLLFLQATCSSLRFSDSSNMGHHRNHHIWSCRSPPSSLSGSLPRINNPQFHLEIGGKETILNQRLMACTCMYHIFFCFHFIPTIPQEYPLKTSCSMVKSPLPTSVSCPKTQQYHFWPSQRTFWRRERGISCIQQCIKDRSFHGPRVEQWQEQCIDGGFPKWGVPQQGWFIRENPIKMDDLEVPLFQETPTY